MRPGRIDDQQAVRLVARAAVVEGREESGAQRERAARGQGRCGKGLGPVWGAHDGGDASTGS